ncbi:MAG: D-alanine--D-alanine ligase [Spirochaetaceae bacterium]|jgi:D-alanine-D-alanine ligase|nr:D-alanine--D-alanine ligase [Spirochaetaceae bacterium]
MRKINVGILCGGKSAEHEVSLQSALNIVNAIDTERFAPVVIGIDKAGRWFLHESAAFVENADNPRKISLTADGVQVTLAPSASHVFRLDTGEKLARLDVVFPVLHGPFGEDGTVQGVLKLAGIPFVGSGVLGSAAGMDKDVTKRLLRDGGVPIGKFIVINSDEALPDFDKISAALGKPVFVKPANMGSSIGVHKVHNKERWEAAVIDAFKYDTKLVIEENINGREIECAVLEGRELLASLPGEISSNHEFYSYDAKYIDGNGAVLSIPAKLSEAEIREIQRLALKSFKLLCAGGLSRVDFFVTEAGGVFVNEINTMPGFTKISMYPKLFEASGISYTNLITELIEGAFARFEREKAIKTTV